MNNLTLIALIIAVSSCSPKTTSQFPFQALQIYGDLANGKPLRDSLIVHLWWNDTLSIGRYAVTSNNNLSVLKTGYWKTNFSNGKKRDEGEYKIGSFVDCCVAGYCMKYYHYKSGIWKYYNEDGALKYELNYKPDTLHVNTNCEGGDKVIFGLIKDFSRLEYKYGLTPDEIFQLQKVEMENNSGDKTILIPISGELVFRYEE